PNALRSTAYRCRSERQARGPPATHRCDQQEEVQPQDSFSGLAPDPRKGNVVRRRLDEHACGNSDDLFRLCVGVVYLLDDVTGVPPGVRVRLERCTSHSLRDGEVPALLGHARPLLRGFGRLVVLEAAFGAAPFVVWRGGEGDLAARLPATDLF